MAVVAFGIFSQLKISTGLNCRLSHIQSLFTTTGYHYWIVWNWHWIKVFLIIEQSGTLWCLNAAMDDTISIQLKWCKGIHYLYGGIQLCLSPISVYMFILVAQWLFLETNICTYGSFSSCLIFVHDIFFPELPVLGHFKKFMRHPVQFVFITKSFQGFWSPLMV